MPLSGDYEPSTSDWARENAEKYMESGGTEGTELAGRPVILLTTVGAKSGKIRKTPLMRVEHNGEYAVVASLGGAPKHPVWYYNITNNPRVELQDGQTAGDYEAREVFGDEKADVVGARGQGVARLCRIPEEDRPADPGLRAHSRELNPLTVVVSGNLILAANRAQMAPLIGVR